MAALLPLSLLITSLSAIQEAPRFGKTNAEILRMGRAGWTKFAAEDRMGGSTAAYVSSETTFGEALRERNDRLLRTKPKFRPAIEGLRKSMNAYGNEFTVIGSGITGGGTMWHMVFAAILPDVEEILYSALVPGVKAKPIPPESRIDQALAKATQTVQRRRRQIDSNREFSNVSYADCMASLNRARALKKEALRLVAPLPKATHAAVRQYLVDAADLQMAE